MHVCIYYLYIIPTHLLLIYLHKFTIYTKKGERERKRRVLSFSIQNKRKMFCFNSLKNTLNDLNLCKTETLSPLYETMNFNYNLIQWE